MSMQKQLWSLNALSNELNMDRRTLAKRLESLPPAEIKQYDNRTEKLWHMADVLAHLKKLEQEKTKQGEVSSVNGFRMIHEEGIKHFIWWLTDEMAPAWTGLIKQETKMDNEAIRQLYATHYGLLTYYMQEYLSSDAFNQALASSAKCNFDQLHEKAHGEAIVSCPPKEDEIEVKLPTVIEELLELELCKS